MIIKKKKKIGMTEFLKNCVVVQYSPMPLLLVAVVGYLLAFTFDTHPLDPAYWTAKVWFVMHVLLTLIMAKELPNMGALNAKIELHTDNTEEGMGEKLTEIFNPFKDSFAYSVSVTGVKEDGKKTFTIRAHVGDNDKEGILEKLFESFPGSIKFKLHEEAGR